MTWAIMGVVLLISVLVGAAAYLQAQKGTLISLSIVLLGLAVLWAVTNVLGEHSGYSTNAVDGVLILATALAALGILLGTWGARIGSPRVVGLAVFVAVFVALTVFGHMFGLVSIELLP